MTNKKNILNDLARKKAEVNRTTSGKDQESLKSVEVTKEAKESKNPAEDTLFNKSSSETKDYVQMTFQCPKPLYETLDMFVGYYGWTKKDFFIGLLERHFEKKADLIEKITKSKKSIEQELF